jgi:hypothetical protein
MWAGWNCVASAEGIQPASWSGWDGTWRGKKCSGVYTYHLKLKKTGAVNYSETLVGTITIVD